MTVVWCGLVPQDWSLPAGSPSGPAAVKPSSSSPALAGGAAAATAPAAAGSRSPPSNSSKGKPDKGKDIVVKEESVTRTPRDHPSLTYQLVRVGIICTVVGGFVGAFAYAVLFKNLFPKGGRYQSIDSMLQSSEEIESLVPHKAGGGPMSPAGGRGGASPKRSAGPAGGNPRSLQSAVELNSTANSRQLGPQQTGGTGSFGDELDAAVTEALLSRQGHRKS